jgi:hypothetical protein
VCDNHPDQRESVGRETPAWGGRRGERSGGRRRRRRDRNERDRRRGSGPHRAFGAAAQVCHDSLLPGGRGGVDGFRIAAPSTGLVRVRLDPATDRDIQADWDIAVFNRADQRLVAASAGPRSFEIGDGYVTAGDDLWVVQGCRFAGRATQAKVMDFEPFGLRVTF